MSAYNTQTPGKYPEDKLSLQQHGESLKTRKCRIAMAKATFNKKRTLFTSTLVLELRKKLVKCYVWSIDLCGAET
jgi:hypothetical protein